MLSGLKTSIMVLVGLLLGIALSLPLAWYGVRRGADSLMDNVRRGEAAVEARQQAMADEALRLQPMLVRFGVTADGDLFDRVQEERSLLAGQAALADKMERVQILEEALLRVERFCDQSGASNRRLARWEDYQEHQRIWEKQKRLLVREELGLVDRVAEFNGLLRRWPASQLLAYHSFGSLLRGLMGDVFGNVAYLGRWTLDWVGYWARRVAALSGQKAPPAAPQWSRPPAPIVVPYLRPMNRPVFLADAPLPEGDYQEIQFTREVPENYADVNLGQDKAVLENQHPLRRFAAPLPTVQTTVTYSGTR